MDTIQKTLKTLPHTPGVYLFKDRNTTVIYVGKARNLYKRVRSYFSNSPILTEKTKQLVTQIHSIQVKNVATEFEALLLEAKLIRSYNPKYNLIAKDDKSPVYIHIQNIQQLPTVQLSRKPKKNDPTDTYYFGPFPSRITAHSILRTLRHSIPFCQQKLRNGRPCFYTHLGLCSPCPSIIDKMTDGKEKRELISLYKKNIQRLIWILSGLSQKTILSLQNDMIRYAHKNDFEKAAFLRNQIQALVSSMNSSYNPFLFEETDSLQKAPDQQLTQLIHVLRSFFPDLSSLHRIECYDISTLQGTSSVGSMVVFVDGIPHTDQYRKFKIKTVSGISDVAMMEEIVRRRLHHTDWPMPEIIVLDGGKAQVSQITAVLQSEHTKIPVIGLSKRFEQIVIQSNKKFFVKTIPLSSPALQLLQHIRDEAHRFAISYHKTLRNRTFAHASLNLI